MFEFWKFSLIKSRFLKESINLNFPLVFRFFVNIIEAFNGRATGLRSWGGTDPKKKSKQKIKVRLGIRFFDNSKCATHLLFSEWFKLRWL